MAVALGHDHNRRIGQIHLVVARHKSAESRPVCRNLEFQPNRITLKQLKKRIDVHPICAQEVGRLGENRLRRQHRGAYLFHQRDGPRVIWVVAVEICHERSRVANRDHDCVNLRRSLVAGFRSPATLPARSEDISYTDRLPLRRPASRLSRINAATLRPVARASCLKRRSSLSGSFIVMPVIIN